MTFSIEFDHPPAGWLTARIRDPDNNIDVEIVGSRLSDCLGDLLDATSTLCHGAKAARCSWPEEPGEYRWILERDGDDLALRVVLAKEWLGQEPDDHARPILATAVGLLRFVRILLSESQRLIDEMGEDAFALEWRRPFPADSFERLQRALRSARSEQERPTEVGTPTIGDPAQQPSDRGPSMPQREAVRRWSDALRAHDVLEPWLTESHWDDNYWDDVAERVVAMLDGQRDEHRAFDALSRALLETFRSAPLLSDNGLYRDDLDGRMRRIVTEALGNRDGD